MELTKIASASSPSSFKGCRRAEQTIVSQERRDGKAKLPDSNGTREPRSTLSNLNTGTDSGPVLAIFRRGRERFPAFAVQGYGPHSEVA